ncbi:DUF6622 family protein [Teredinibacter turnerae]|uniref:DUF6622 family protein n=1 Tax=Teredinibacter turnerae TaxID=2426 RepID=UPI0005F7D432|nr:DUF6622 family protein [Teredinibacter turnerae]
MMELLTKTPVWVYVLFVTLLALGFSQTRTRKPPLAVPFILPVLMSLYSAVDTVLHFSADGRGLGIAIVSATCAWGYVRKSRIADGIIYLPEEKRFEIKGSFTPLIIILCIFTVKYIHGAISALRPELAQTITFISIFAFFNGIFFGFFTARIALFWDIYRARSIEYTKENLTQSL